MFFDRTDSFINGRKHLVSFFNLLGSKPVPQFGTLSRCQRFDYFLDFNQILEAERPNAIWQTDHTLLDIPVQRESENPAQPWPRVILDDYSRAVAGLFLFFEAPSAAQAALALRQALSAKRLLLDFTLAPFRGSRLRIVSADVVIDRFA